MVKEGETLTPERGLRVSTSIKVLNEKKTEEKKILAQHIPRISLMFSRIPQSCCGTLVNPPEENQR